MWRIILETVLIAAVLVSASVHDVRSREVPDMHWVVAGSATVLGHWYFAPDPTVAVLASAGTLSVLACTVRDLPERVLIPSGFLLSVTSILMGYTGLTVTLVMTVFFLAMYRLGMIRGGADTKALIVLAMAYPAYPEIPPLPLFWQPFSPADLLISLPFGTLMLALLFSLLGGALCMSARNLRDGNTGPRMFSTLRVPLDEAENGFYWPLEDAERQGSGYRIYRISAGNGDGGTIGRLRASGAEKVTVTPMIPFLVPIAAAFVTIVVLGNPVFMS